MFRTAVLLAAALVSAPYSAGAEQTYGGLAGRAVKALSEQQAADLRAGRGMGFALAAELNGYPGPMHVLELAGELDLSAAQRDRVQALFEAMRAEAVPIGERLIALEADLDRSFAAKTITTEGLYAATAAIGATQAQLRATHLRYHIETADVLTAPQIGRYAELRRAADAAPSTHGHTRPHR